MWPKKTVWKFIRINERMNENERTTGVLKQTNEPTNKRMDGHTSQRADKQKNE